MMAAAAAALVQVAGTALPALAQPKALAPAAGQPAQSPQAQAPQGQSPSSIAQQSQPARPVDPRNADPRSGAAGGALPGIVSEPLPAPPPLPGSPAALRALWAQAWRNTPQSLYLSLLRRLPVAAPSPVMQGLMQQLLTGESLPADVKAPTQVLAARMERLVALGRFEAALALLAAHDGPVDAPVIEAQTEALLLSGDIDTACGLARERLKIRNEALDQEVLALCALRSGAGEEAQLRLTLLRELGFDDPPLFAALETALGSKGIPLPKPDRLSAILIRMTEAARLPLPAEAAADSRPGYLQAVARHDPTPREIRAQAAERAEAAGALATDDLFAYYEAFAFKPEDLDRAFSLAAQDRTPRGRALLQRVIDAQSVPAARAAVLQKAWSILRGRGGYLASLRINREFLGGMTPRPELAFFAEDAGRAALIDGSIERAVGWFRLAAREGGGRGALMLFPLARVAGIKGDETAPTSERVDAWLAQISRQEPGRAAGRAALLSGLLATFGDGLPVGAWASLAMVEGSARETLSPELIIGLRQAAATRQLGPTVAFALLALGADGPAGAGAVTVSDVVAALLAAGLPGEARMVAVEAMVGAGL